MKKQFRRNAWLIIAALLIVMIVLLRLFVFHLARVEGSSMENTLTGGDVVLVGNYLGVAPERGDIVECSFPGRSGMYFKRVVGLPGESVEIAGGRLYIDGSPLSEPYASGPMEDYAIRLEDHQYLLLGDNRPESYDSRAADMGPVGKENIHGLVRLVLWPPEWIG